MRYFNWLLFVLRRRSTSSILVIFAGILAGMLGWGTAKTIEQSKSIELTDKEETSLIASSAILGSSLMFLIIRLYHVDITIYRRRKEEIRTLVIDSLRNRTITPLEALLLLADATVTPLKDSGISSDNKIYSILESIRSDFHKIIKETFLIIQGDIYSDPEYSDHLYDIDFLERLLATLSSVYEEDKVVNYNFFDFLPWEKRKRIHRVINIWREKYNLNLERIKTVNVEHIKVNPPEIEPGKGDEISKYLNSNPHETTPETEIIENKDEDEKE